MATSVLLASSSTTGAEFIAIEPSTTSGHAKNVGHARSDHNAPVLPSGALSSTRTNQPDNVREQFFLAAVAQNFKRLVRFLSQPITPVLPTTT